MVMFVQLLATVVVEDLQYEQGDGKERDRNEIML